MKIYNYSNRTLEYVGEEEVTLDPIGGKPLIPAYATTIAPPVTGVNQAAVFIDNAWQISLDKRGTRYWVSNDAGYEIKLLGEDVPAEATLIAPPSSDHVLENGLWRVKTAQEIDDEKEAIAQLLNDLKPVINSVLEIVYENPDLVAAFANIGVFKTAVKDRYKSKLV